MTNECAIEILQIRKIKYCNPDESDAWRTLKTFVELAQQTINKQSECAAQIAAQMKAVSLTLDTGTSVEGLKLIISQWSQQLLTLS